MQAGQLPQTAAGGIGNLLASSEIAWHSASPQGILVFFRDQVGKISSTAIHKWKQGVSFSLFNAGLRELRASNCTRHVFPAKALLPREFSSVSGVVLPKPPVQKAGEALGQDPGLQV